MGQAGKDRVACEYAWERKGEVVSGLYYRLAGTRDRGLSAASLTA